MARPRIALRTAHALGLAALILALGAPTAAAASLAPPKGDSPAVADMHDAYVVIAVLATLLAVGVNLALILAATRKSSSPGEHEAAEAVPSAPSATPRRALAALGALAVAVFITGDRVPTRSRRIPAGTGAEAGKQLDVRVAGQQWLWRYTYPDGTFSYYELVVPVGRTVRLAIDSTDVVHRWWVPELTGMAEAVPGRLNPVYFRADQPGVYDGRSSAFSGQSYAAMRIRVRAVSDSEFTTWLSNQKAGILTAQAAVQKSVGEAGASAKVPSASGTPGVSQTGASQ